MIKNSEDNSAVEILSPEEYIHISRYSSPIRWLHWFNAIMILLLYALAIRQFMELSELDHSFIQDSRFWHWTTGIIWSGGLVVLMLLLWQGERFQLKDTIVSDKLIVKQRLFLALSVLYIGFMVFSGVGLYLLREIEAPAIRNILLVLHTLSAILYIPPLLVHLYLALFKPDTRKSLYTMITDATIKFLLHSSMKGLKCQLSDENQILFLQMEVIDLSLVDFRVQAPKGHWWDWANPADLTYVDFMHDDLAQPVRLPIGRLGFGEILPGNSYDCGIQNT